MRFAFFIASPCIGSLASFLDPCGNAAALPADYTRVIVCSHELLSAFSPDAQRLSRSCSRHNQIPPTPNFRGFYAIHLGFYKSEGWGVMDQE